MPSPAAAQWPASPVCAAATTKGRAGVLTDTGISAKASAVGVPASVAARARAALMMGMTYGSVEPCIDNREGALAYWALSPKA